MQTPALLNEAVCDEWLSEGIPFDRIDELVGDLTWDQWKQASREEILPHCERAEPYPLLTEAATASVLASRVQQSRERHKLARRLRGEAHGDDGRGTDPDPAGE